MIEPGPGRRPALPRELFVRCESEPYPKQKTKNDDDDETYPRWTPSTRMSIHHTPGRPSMHHRFALRRAPPAGVH